MFHIQFNVSGDVQIERAIIRFAEGVSDYSEPLQLMADDFHKTVIPKQFKSEGTYGSGGWQPLSSKYASWKARAFPGRKILVLSGQMKESLQGGNAWSIEEVGPLKMSVGSQMPLAAWHQQGTRRMPARPPIDLTEADKKRWTNFVQVWLKQRANKEFAGLMPTIKSGEKHIKSI